MALETASFIDQLNPAYPSGSDRIHQGDDHIRMLKAVLKATFPALTGPVTQTQDELNNPFSYPMGIISAWWGTEGTVPEGWAVCDGSTVARSDGQGDITLPDLRNRTIFGAGDQYAVGQLFGASSHNMTTSQNGAHQHTIAGGAHSHNVNVQSTSASPSIRTTTVGVENEQRQETVIKSVTLNGGAAHSHTAEAESATHTHSVSTEGAHQHTATIPTVPPAMGLHFIMKV